MPLAKALLILYARLSFISSASVSSTLLGMRSGPGALLFGRPAIASSTCCVVTTDEISILRIGGGEFIILVRSAALVFRKN